MFIDKCINMAKLDNCGIVVDNKRVNTLLCVDDAVLVANFESELQEMT